MDKALVIAANNKEDTGWTREVPDNWQLFIFDDYHPPGRESWSYLQFCIYHADDFDEVVFCQGDPFKHDPAFLAHLQEPMVRHYGMIHECDWMAAPAYNAPLHSWCDVFDLKKQPVFRFVAGAQYRVKLEQIQLHSREFYSALRNLTHVNPKSPWIIERLWPVIWNMDYLL